MGVTVHLPGVLRADAGGAAHLPVDVGPSAVLRDVLDGLVSEYPGLDRRIRDEQGRLRRYVNVFVGNEECRALEGLDTPVEQGADIRVLPSVAGG
ncbi:Sulfur carrier protein CysO [Nocardiopsis dassonvillei]|uniref:ubiquitin-like small modifier protein 1 n=1 Tax=Nocardiopsis dassonvillei TaxID=2014 RepID=UPI003F56CE3D